MADPISRSSNLPPFALLDLDKVKRESAGYSSIHPPATVAMSAPPPLASPSGSTFSGPPPPYSYPSSANSSVVGSNGNHGAQAVTPFAPSHHQQTRVEDKEHGYAQPKQSLPSISEALSIQSMLNSNPPSKPSVTSRSPISPSFRHPNESSRPVDDAYIQRAPRETQNFDQTRRTSATMYSPHVSTFAPQQSPVVHDNFNFSQPPRPTTGIQDLPTYTRPSVSNVQPPPISPATTAPPLRHEPASSSPYGHSAYQPAYSYPPTTPATTSFQTPFSDSWKNNIAEQERADDVRRALTKESPQSGRAYGESVKRHLDFYDLETSLNEIARGSGQALEFAQHYGDSRHATQRSGPTATSLPSLDAVEAMIAKQHEVLTSFHRIKDILIKQQMALEQQRNYDSQHFKHSSNDPEDNANPYSDKMDGVGGFAGADAKKRRGRAAPPGRCHSCNRAETPEWRRGPDGARTLCNACGLHYAKLTRKMGGNKNATGSSNLRPKESSPSSP